MKTRREFLTLTASVAAGAALGPRRAAAAPKAMTVVRESSFIKAFDDYFAKTLLPEYEKLTGIKMSYEAVSVGGMLTRLTTIAETKSGPEIAMTAINWPHLFDSSLVDVTDLATEIGKKIGPWHDNIFDAAVVNKKWKALPWGNIGQLEVYRTDWFKEAGAGRTCSPPAACSRRRATRSASSWATASATTTAGSIRSCGPTAAARSTRTARRS